MIHDSPPAIIFYAPVVCQCPTCRRLDLRYPRQGRQLALFPYREQRAPKYRTAGPPTLRLVE